jgi:hypothetical protein
VGVPRAAEGAERRARPQLLTEQQYDPACEMSAAGAQPSAASPLDRLALLRAGLASHFIWQPRHRPPFLRPAHPDLQQHQKPRLLQ